MPMQFKDTADTIFKDTADAVWDKDDVVYVYYTLPITITLEASAPSGTLSAASVPGGTISAGVPGGTLNSSDLSTTRTIT